MPTPEQVTALMLEANRTPWEIPVLLAVATGARRGEVLAITWSNTRLEHARMRITHSLQRVVGEEGSFLSFVDPKTSRARREVSLPAWAVERLRRWRVEQSQRRLIIGSAWEDRDLVCDRGDGGALDPDAFTGAFKRFAARAGLPPAVRLHDIRHAVATALLERGVHPAIASAVLGHASPAFTMGVYQHVLDEMTGVAAAALDEAFGPG